MTLVVITGATGKIGGEVARRLHGVPGLQLRLVGPTKKDFLGKRSLDRPDSVRENRRQLVGLLSADGMTRLEEGAQIVAADTPITPEDGPVPMIGWVSSSYLSAELGQPFALALIDGA